MIKLSVFCWNLQSVRYYNKKEDSLEQKPVADFIENLSSKLNSDIVIIALQEDSIRDSPILNLIKEYKEEFIEIDSVELSGWGSTTYKALKNNLEYLPRGLRLSVLKNKKLKLDIKTKVSSYVCPSIIDNITWGKGAVAVHLDIENYGEIIVADVHLPFSSKGLRDSNTRKDNLKWQATCLDYIYKNLVEKSSRFIIAGDLNFRVDLNSGTMLDILNEKDPAKLELELQQVYNNNDELRRCLDLNLIPHMLEGVKNIGANFIPTCKLYQDRKPGEFKFNIGKHSQRTPSWCDRILYSDCYNSSESSYSENIECIGYERFESGNMSLSDHAAVIGEFVLAKN